MSVERHISITGLGYIGPPQAVVLANAGFQVWGYDIKQTIVDTLAQGKPTIEEAGLDGLLRRNAERLHFTTNLKEAMKNTSVHYFCVGTPPKKDGSGEADTQYVFQAIKETAEAIKSFGNRERPDLFVIKSTVPPFTNNNADQLIRDIGLEHFHVISNPEFGAEGTMVDDFDNPHKILIGADPKRPHYDYAVETMRQINRPFMSNSQDKKFLVDDPLTIELAKYFCNGQLFANISYANDGAALCDKVGANWGTIRKSMVLDRRIGGTFHYPSAKAGGNCFPKDSLALEFIGKKFGVPMYVISGAIKRNNAHPLYCAEKLEDMFGGDVGGKTISLWGLSFKPETDDCRYTAALDICDYFLRKNKIAGILAYDCIEGARKNFAKEIKQLDMPHKGKINIVDSLEPTLNSHAIMLLTESKEYRSYDYSQGLGSSVCVFVDTRNALDKTQIDSLRKNFVSYTGNGRYNKRGGQ